MPQFRDVESVWYKPYLALVDRQQIYCSQILSRVNVNHIFALLSCSRRLECLPKFQPLIPFGCNRTRLLIECCLRPFAVDDGAWLFK